MSDPKRAVSQNTMKKTVSAVTVCWLSMATSRRHSSALIFGN